MFFACSFINLVPASLSIGASLMFILRARLLLWYERKASEITQIIELNRACRLIFVAPRINIESIPVRRRARQRSDQIHRAASCVSADGARDALILATGEGDRPEIEIPRGLRE